MSAFDLSCDAKGREEYAASSNRRTWFLFFSLLSNLLSACVQRKPTNRHKRAWFYLLTVQMEMDAAPGLVAALMSQADLCAVIRLLRVGDRKGNGGDDEKDLVRMSPTKSWMGARSSRDGGGVSGEKTTAADPTTTEVIKKEKEEKKEEAPLPVAERERRIRILLSRISHHCNVVAASLAAMTRTFRRMRENCDPHILCVFEPSVLPTVRFWPRHII